MNSMNVYRISTFPKPPGNKFQNYAQLLCKKSDEGFLDCGHFNGHPFPKPWRRVRLHFGEPLCPRADFYNLGIGNFVCTERARVLTGPALESAGEFFPVIVEGEDENHYIYNVTNCRDCTHLQKSIWEHDRDEPEDPKMWEDWKIRKAKQGYVTFRSMVAPAFDPRKVGKETIFKIPDDWGMEIYCAELTANPAKNEFKALVEHHKLSGFEFEFAWSEKKGPSTKKCPPMKGDDILWRTGDGKKYKAK